jgi:hypothetical protein
VDRIFTHGKGFAQKGRLSGYRTASGSERDKNSNKCSDGGDTSSKIKYRANPDIGLSACPARYRSRFCTKRFVGFQAVDSKIDLLGKATAGDPLNHTKNHENQNLISSESNPILYLPPLTFSNSSNLFSKARIRFGRSPNFLKTAIARQKALTSNAGVPTRIWPAATSLGTPLCG